MEQQLLQDGQLEKEKRDQLEDKQLKQKQKQLLEGDHWDQLDDKQQLKQPLEEDKWQNLADEQQQRPQLQEEQLRLKGQQLKEKHQLLKEYQQLDEHQLQEKQLRLEEHQLMEDQQLLEEQKQLENEEADSFFLLCSSIEITLEHYFNTRFVINFFLICGLVFEFVMLVRGAISKLSIKICPAVKFSNIKKVTSSEFLSLASSIWQVLWKDLLYLASACLQIFREEQPVPDPVLRGGGRHAAAECAGCQPSLPGAQGPARDLTQKLPG